VDASLEGEFSEFMVGRWSSLVRFGYGLTGDLGLAEDLVQTALIRACVAWLRVRRADDPEAYVRRIMINANRNRFRRRRVAELLTGTPPDGGVGQPGQPGRPDPSGRTGEEGPELITALLRLPVGQRAVLVLRYWMDLSEAQTAASLGCSVGNVKSQAARGLAKLRTDPTLAHPAGATTAPFAADQPNGSGDENR
jgi:RNA polymerase sigma-70 factor (sigma-E family)